MQHSHSSFLRLALFPLLLSSLAGGQEKAQPDSKTTTRPVPSYRLWREDLEQLGEEFPKRHKNAFFRISEKAWRKLVADSIHRIGPGTDLPHFVAELLRVCAAIGDGHSQVAWYQVGLPTAPIRFTRFSDGVFVTFLPKDKPALKGAKVRSLQGVPMEEVLKKLRSFVPAENESFFNSQAVYFLSIPSLLQAFGIGKDPKVLRVGIQDGGKQVTVDIPAIPFGQKPKVPLVSSFRKVPEYLGRARKDYSYRFLKAGKVLYLAYNRCRNLKAFSKLVASMVKELKQKKPTKFILDLRRNGGGSSLVLTPLLGQFLVNPVLKKAKRYCLIGRRTFSSALLNAITMKQKFHATLVGEPTGGKPNHFGEIRPFKLKNSHLTVYYSTKHFKRVPGDPDSLVPDKLIPLTSKEAFAGKDPGLRFCLEDSPVESASKDPGGRHFE